MLTPPLTAPGTAHLLDVPAGVDPGAAGAALVGRSVVDDVDLTAAPDTPALDRPALVLVTGGAGQLAGAARLAGRSRAGRGTGPEETPGAGAAFVVTLRDLDDLAGNARRVSAATEAARADGLLAEDTPVLVALPAARPGGGWLAAADEIAAAGLGLALRAVDPRGPLPADTVVEAIDAALDRECPVAWLGDHPLLPAAGAAPAALALLLATRHALDGEDAAGVLALPAHDLLTAVADRLAGDPDCLERARRWCTGVGCADPAGAAAALAGTGLVLR